MAPWIPLPDLHRAVLAAAHAGLSPWTPAAPFLTEGTPASGSDILSAVTQQFLGYGVVGCLALALAWIVYKGKFVPREQVDALVAAGRADLLRENEQLRADLTKAQEQVAENLRFAKEDLTPILFQFTSATTSLLPILQQVGYLLPILQQAAFRQQSEQPPRRDPQ